MKYLLDVSVLVAWGWSDHAEHERAARWIAATRAAPDAVLLTSPIPQLGFVRVSVQRAGTRVSVAEASSILAGMLASLGASHELLPDDQQAYRLPGWCSQASRTTDAHLLRLAETHHATLATLDTGIPGAFLLPAPPAP